MERDKVSIAPALYIAVFPMLIMFYLSYFGMDILSSIFKHVPLVSGGVINRNFLYESIYLNSAASYLGVVSGAIVAISYTPILNPVSVTAAKFIKVFTIGLLVFLALIYFIEFSSQGDLSVSTPPFRRMSQFYFTTSLLYSVMYTGAYYFTAFFTVISSISFSIKIIYERFK